MPPAVEVQSLTHWTTKEVPLLFSSSSFSISGLRFKSSIHFEFIFFLICSETGVQHFSSAYGYMDIQLVQHHLLKRLSFPCCVFLTPYWRLIDKDSWIYFWVLYTVSLVYMSLCQNHSFDYCSFVMHFENRQCDTYSSCSKFFGQSGSFVVPYEFQNCFYLFQSAIRILIGIAMNL